MKNVLVFFFLFTFGGMASQNLEESIYKATETFNASKSERSLEHLNTQIATFKLQLSNIDEHFAFMSLLVNKAYFLNQNNKQQDAISTYEAALKHYKNYKIAETYQYNIVDYCFIPLGNLYTKAGDYTNAENTIKQYIFLAEKTKNNKQRISGAINLAQLYYAIGKFQSAVTIADNGLKINPISNVQLQKLKSIKNNSLVQSKESTREIIDKINITETRHDTNLKYQLALKNKDYKTALNLFYLKPFYTKKEPPTARESAKHNLEEAELHYKLQDFKKASQALKIALSNLLPNHTFKTLPQKSNLYPENTFIDIFDLLARLQKDSQQALQCYDLSFYVSELLIENLTSAESKVIHLYTNRQRNESCISLLFEQYQQRPDTSIIRRAFNYAEKNKASILKESIEKKSLLALHPKDSLLLKEQALLSKNETLTNTLIIAQYTKNSEKVNATSTELTTISLQLKTIKTLILKRYPNSEPDFTLNNLQQKLKQDKAILTEYFFGDYAVYQFTVTASSLAFNKIEKDDSFNRSIKTYISFFKNASTINNDIEAYKTEAYKLFNLLHFNETSLAENLVIIPDGLLNFIPFESLLTKETKTNSYAKMPFVITNQNVAYNSSASFYLNNKTRVKTQNLLAVFPVFKGSSNELKYSIDEAESIDKYADAKFLMHATATKKAFINSAHNYSILHLSTHANSGTFSEPSYIEFFDSTLYLNELYSLNLKADLVVLSACETGIGKLQKGEGSINLARGFQYAGAKNILFSLWKINDLSTSQLMHQFYKNYETSESAFIANHASKINYLNNESINNIKKSPYYWSPFVFYGDISEPQTSFTRYYIFIGILCLLIILFLSFRFYKKHGKTT
jgi:CHAT domain-containing protein